MAADVVERADLQIGIAHQEHRPAGDGDRHDIAGPGQLVSEAGEDPGVGEDALVLELEDRLARVGGSRQSPRHRPGASNAARASAPRIDCSDRLMAIPCAIPLERAPAKARGP